MDYLITYEIISIHAPARGATESDTQEKTLLLFQSTLPQGERRVPDLLRRQGNKISIHAPARGATLEYTIEEWAEDISIHAPARGATVPRGNRGRRYGFQSTLPQGERQVRLLIIDDLGAISIHAPARGATMGRPPVANPKSISIHAPARGATAHGQAQSALLQISIHAPARGATALLLSHPFEPSISIHAPARGATRLRAKPFGETRISIHAPARGATAIITNFHTQLLFKITIFSYIASPLSFPSSLFPDI